MFEIVGELAPEERGLPLVDIKYRPSPEACDAMTERGVEVPLFKRRALVDTGATVSFIGKTNELRDGNVFPFGVTPVETSQGLVKVNSFDLELSLPGCPPIVRTVLSMQECDGFDAILGLDLICGSLFLNTLARTFKLELPKQSYVALSDKGPDWLRGSTADL